MSRVDQAKQSKRAHHRRALETYRESVCVRIARGNWALHNPWRAILSVVAHLIETVPVYACRLVGHFVVDSDDHTVTNIAADCRTWPFPLLKLARV
jgi:hypothetical protein